MKTLKPIHIIGAGLAGSEAAWQVVKHNIPVILHEMRPVKKTNAHNTGDFAELVCSNSFRSDDADYNAVGLLHREMRACDSLIMKTADEFSVPAGGALAVDREKFSQKITQTLMDHPLITIERSEVTDLPPTDWGHTIIATGPLTSERLAKNIQSLTGEESLAFFDAIAPIIYKESIDFDKAWFQSRYDKHSLHGTASDYINCPFEKDEYSAFIDALLSADQTEFKEWEKNTPYFEGCLPIEVMASRGIDTLRFGPMKPVGLTNPKTGKQAHAVVQLRQDNALGTLYNMVGFQTKLKYGAQKDVFQMIPGLENAEFARLGGIHRNTFINSPKILNETLKLKLRPDIRMAGQIIGVEGYVESAAIGLLAGRFSALDRLNIDITPPPLETALGALLHHVSGGANSENFQPMNVNFGLFPPISVPNVKKLKGKDRKLALSQRAQSSLDKWIKAA